MKRLIAVDSPLCHYFAVEISEARYHRPKYMEALYNSIEMTFKKLKYHKGKMDITITEIDYDTSTETNPHKQKTAKGFAKAGEKHKGSTLAEADLGKRGVLAGQQAVLPASNNADRTWDKGVQAEIQRRERKNKLLQEPDVEDI